MKLHVLGSSSRGNCYLLRSETTGEVLAVEAGVRFNRVKEALGFDIHSIVGCIVTHEHGDHAKYVDDFLRARIPIHMSSGTMHKVIDMNATGPIPLLIEAGAQVKIGGFKVMAFDVQHDAAEPLGYLIHHPECGTVLFATDTYFLKYKFAGLSNVMIECNYRLDILEHNIASGTVSPVVRNRIIKSHMSYGTCVETLQANDLSRVNNILLIHLSGDNSNAGEFVRGIHAATGKNVMAARKGMTIDFNKTPY